MLHHDTAHAVNIPDHNSNRSTSSNRKARANEAEKNIVGIPIPNQVTKRRHLSVTNSMSSEEESFQPGDVSNDGSGSPVTAFSRSLSGHQSSTPLNVYSMSPRSTSVMYQYYSTPRGYYQHNPLSRAKSTEHSKACARQRIRIRTMSESCNSSPPPPGVVVTMSPPPHQPATVNAGIPQVFQSDVIEDPRRRAWSESDSNKKSHMHSSRMSALRKLKKKLSRTPSLKKKKEEVHAEGDSMNTSVNSVNALVKVEEGRQLEDSTGNSSSSSRQTAWSNADDCANRLSALSLHQEDETVKYNPQKCNCDVTVPEQQIVVNPEADLIYQRFLEEHTCYDIMPTSCKLVVFDTKLSARKAFDGLISNAVRSAPLWDSRLSRYIGMLTVTDFINLIIIYHSEGLELETLEEENLESWRRKLGQEADFESVRPDETLLRSLQFLSDKHFHGVPVLDPASGDVFHVINHKRILRFLYIFMNELPAPSFMSKTIKQVGIGTYKDVSTVTKDDNLLDVLKIIADKRLTAIPVVDESGEVVDVFCKLDMVPLAAQGLHCDLSIKLDVALVSRSAPLFEDENETVDAYTRFSSPKPVRKDLSRKPTHRHSTNNAPNITSLLEEYTSTKGHTNRPRSASVKGHKVQRPGPNHASRQTTKTDRRPPLLRQQSLPDSVTYHDGNRSRHKSMSNPLVKCRSSDKVQYVIDLLVSTDANLLVVVEPTSDHVIGVVTVSDVLQFITSPQASNFNSKKEAARSSMYSSASSIPSDDLGSASQLNCDDTQPLFHSNKSSSEMMFNDSGYTSTTSIPRRVSDTRKPLIVSFADQIKSEINTRQPSGQVLRNGVKIERL